MTSLQTPGTPQSTQGSPNREGRAERGIDYGVQKPRTGGSRLRPSRIATVVVLLAGLGFSLIARMWAMALQAEAAASNPYTSANASAGGGRTPSFGNMDSFALALLLGGLRGPLVMFLWIESEGQKNERDLQDVNTMIEWIRLLQPEFDRVHIFQIWNVAFNISVQMPSLPDRYRAILEALDYAKRMDLAKPNDINLLLALDMLYNGKLGGTTTDKVYYIRQVREDTAYQGKRAAAAGPRRHVDRMLDEAGNVLPQYVTPLHPRPANLPASIIVPAKQVAAFDQAVAAANLHVDPTQVSVFTGSDPIKHDGDHVLNLDEGLAHRIEAVAGDLPGVLFTYSDFNEDCELQYLPRYQPYHYGLSPLALGYNYAKRAQVLMTLGGQSPEQMGRTVVDTKPAQELRQWSEEEWGRATDAEFQLFGKPINPQAGQSERELVTEASRPEDALLFKSKDPAQAAKAREALNAALDAYSLAARLTRDSRAEYARHLKNPEAYINRFQDYRSTIDGLVAEEMLVRADRDYLAAVAAQMKGDAAARRKALESSAEEYHEAAIDYEFLMMRYYVQAEQIAPALQPLGYTRETLYQFRTAQPEEFRKFFVKMTTSLRNADANAADRIEFGMYRDRANKREADVRSLLAGGGSNGAGQSTSATGPATAPTTAPTTAPATEPAVAPATAPSAP